MLLAIVLATGNEYHSVGPATENPSFLGELFSMDKWHQGVC